MSRANIAVACCRPTVDAPADDLYPDGDLAPLMAAFVDAGAAAVAVSWDHPEVEWTDFAHVVVAITSAG